MAPRNTSLVFSSDLRRANAANAANAPVLTMEASSELRRQRKSCFLQEFTSSKCVKGHAAASVRRCVAVLAAVRLQDRRQKEVITPPTHTHTHRRGRRQGPSEFKNELTKAKEKPKKLQRSAAAPDCWAINPHKMCT